MQYSTSITPAYDALVYSILPSFRSTSLVARDSLLNAKAAILHNKANDFQESMIPKEVKVTIAPRPELDRLAYNPLDNFRLNSRKEETSLKQALVDIGTNKANKFERAAIELKKGNFDTVEWMLGRPLSAEEKETAQLSFITEKKIAKLKAEERIKKMNSPSAFYQYRTPTAPPLGSFRGPSSRVPVPPRAPQPGPSRSVSSIAPTQYAPTVSRIPVYQSASHSQYAPALRQTLGIGPPPSSAAAAAAAAGPAHSHSQLSQSALDDIASIRAAGGNFQTQKSSINLVLTSEGKDAGGNFQTQKSSINLVLTSEGKDALRNVTNAALLTELGKYGYTGKGLTGKGLRVYTHPNQRSNIEFGRYNLDKNKLAQNILSFAHKGTNHSVTGLPSTRVSEKLKYVVLGLINGMPVNLDTLSADEMEYFRHIMKSTKKEFKNPISNNNSALSDRLEIIIGEIGAGNSSKALKTELSQTLNSLHQAGLISGKQVNDATARYIKGDIR